MISALIDYIEKMTGNNLRSARATAPGHSNKPPPGCRGSGWRGYSFAPCLRHRSAMEVWPPGTSDGAMAEPGDSPTPSPGAYTVARRRRFAASNRPEAGWTNP